jgi:hypothetical protein
MADEMTMSVVSVLLSERTKKIKPFTYGSYTFDPNSFGTLAGNMFYWQTPRVIHVPGAKKEAGYNSDIEAFFFGFKSPQGRSQKALVIHEATHAIQDMQAAVMNIADSEVIAYITQCQYARVDSQDGLKRLYSDDAAKDKVFELGWHIATKLQTNQTPTQEDYNELRAAVCASPMYAKNAADAAGFNGF